MDIFKLFPEKLQNDKKYPYFKNTSEVLQVCVAMYHDEIVESIKQLYNVGGAYYKNNISKGTYRSRLVKDNLDKLMGAFLPFIEDFIYTKTYEEKRGLLSFSDAFFSTKGTTDNLVSMLKLLNFPMSIYTRDKVVGGYDAFTLQHLTAERDNLEEEDPLDCGAVLPNEYIYKEGKWTIYCNDRPVEIYGRDLYWRGRSSYNIEGFQAHIEGYIFIEKGKEYSWICGADDGCLFEIDGYGRCHVPYNNIGDPTGGYEWEDLNSWKPVSPNSWGSPFKWGSNWINFIAEETGYVKIKVTKEGDQGTTYAANIVGGETSKVRASIAEAASKANASLFQDYESDVSGNEKYKPPRSFADVTYENLPRWLLKLGCTDKEGNVVAGTLPLVLSAPYQEMIYQRGLPPKDPASLINKYDVVISINMNDPAIRDLINEASDEARKRYSLSLTGAITKIIDNFIWVCADAIAYFYYASSDVIYTESTIRPTIAFSFVENTTASLVYSSVSNVSTGGELEQLVKPEVDGYPYIDKIGNTIINNNLASDLISWDDHSNINGTVGSGSARACITNRYLEALGVNFPLVFQRGGVYVNELDAEGGDEEWFEDHPFNTWATYNEVKESRDKLGGNKLDKYFVNVFNNLANKKCPVGVLSPERMPVGSNYINSGDNNPNDKTIAVVDKIIINLS